MSHPQDLSCPRDAVEMSGQALMEAADYTTTLETLETLETTQTQDLMEDCLFCLKEVKTAPPPALTGDEDDQEDGLHLVRLRRNRLPLRQEAAGRRY